ncbi:hypothetical protein B9479_006548 [Cryptococcus floricola]|uniref:Uncharacterized protein n=1 Tax=Cryptococcus floricola TaxID=2591691 RepID=A0A5D3AMW0_9TREE|nr:hypothetical protein B9479_006548 [Cryptococcus floricola]
MDANENQHVTENPQATASSNDNAQQVGSQQDALDKGVSAAFKQFGYNNADNSTVEKASDAIRSGFKSFTGKDFPIADKE